MSDKELMQQALEALRFGLHVGFDESSESQIKKSGKAFDQHSKAISALRERLAQPEQEPVAIEYWLQDTMESGRWVTTDNMAKATAEKMLSGEYGDVYPQGRIVEPSPSASKPWVGLTDEEKAELDAEYGDDTLAHLDAIEAKLREKNA